MCQAGAPGDAAGDSKSVFLWESCKGLNGVIRGEATENCWNKQSGGMSRFRCTDDPAERADRPAADEKMFASLMFDKEPAAIK